MKRRWHVALEEQHGAVTAAAHTLPQQDNESAAALPEAPSSSSLSLFTLTHCCFCCCPRWFPLPTLRAWGNVLCVTFIHARHSSGGLTRQLRHFRQRRPVCFFISLGVTATVLSFIAFFVVLFAFTEYLVLTTGIAFADHSLFDTSSTTAAATVRLRAHSPLLPFSHEENNAMGHVPQEVILPVHSLFVHLAAFIGVDLIAHERAWSCGIAGFCEDADDGDEEGQGVYDAEACVAVRAGNTTSIPWDPLQLPQMPTRARNAMGGESATAKGQQRLLLREDSTVLMLFRPISSATPCARTSKTPALDEAIRDTSTGNAATAAFELITEEVATGSEEATEDNDGRQNSEEMPSSFSRPFDLTRKRLEQSFRDVAAVFVSDRHPPSADVSATPRPVPQSPFHLFFAQQRATLWELYGHDEAHKTSNHQADTVTASFFQRLARPLRIDIVFTFVDPNTESFKRAQQLRAQQQQTQHRATSTAARVRDWGELRYALRSLDRYVLDSPAMHQYVAQLQADADVLASEMSVHVPDEVRAALSREASSRDAKQATRSLLGDVYLVVADRDQVPAWVKHEVRHALPSEQHRLHVVTHADLLRSSETTDEQHPCLFYANQSRSTAHGTVLPTFNSRVIESLLHRIPRLSRFYLYANNDGLFGQLLSPFDLLRPLAPARQELRFARLGAEMAQRADANTTVATSTAAASHRCRTALFLEAILHREAVENAWQPSINASVFASIRPPSSALTSSSSQNSTYAFLEEVQTREAYVREELRKVRRCVRAAVRQCASALATEASHAPHPPLEQGQLFSAPPVQTATMSATNADGGGGVAAFEGCVALTSARFFQAAVNGTRDAPEDNSRSAPLLASPLFAGFATRPLFRIPRWILDSPHGKQPWHATLEHWDGVTPALSHPHITALLDREWMAQTVEGDLQAEVALMRQHAQRRGFGELIPVSAFIFFSVAKRRWLERQLWAEAVAASADRSTLHAADHGAAQPSSRRIHTTAAPLLLDEFASPTLRRVAARVLALSSRAAQQVSSMPLLLAPDVPLHLQSASARELQRQQRRLVKLQDVYNAAGLREGLRMCQPSGSTTSALNSPVRMDDLGPLYGDVHAVHTQHPFLLDHLASWWMALPLVDVDESDETAVQPSADSRVASPLPSPLRSSPHLVNPCWAHPLRHGPRTRHDLLRYPKLLRTSLPLPSLFLVRSSARSTRCEDQINESSALPESARTQRSKCTPSPPAASTSPSSMSTRRRTARIAQRTRQWNALFLDVNYHWRDGWPLNEADVDAPWRSPPNTHASSTWQHGENNDNASRGMTDAAGFVALRGHRQMEQLTEQFSAHPRSRPVQFTFNDDFPSYSSAARQAAAIAQWNASMAQLFDVYTEHAPPSRWER